MKGYRIQCIRLIQLWIELLLLSFYGVPIEGKLHQFTYSEFDGFEWDRNQSRVDPTDGEP